MLVTKLKMQRSPYGDSRNFAQTEHLKCNKNEGFSKPTPHFWCL